MLSKAERIHCTRWRRFAKAHTYIDIHSHQHVHKNKTADFFIRIRMLKRSLLAGVFFRKQKWHIHGQMYANCPIFYYQALFSGTNFSFLKFLWGGEIGMHYHRDIMFPRRKWSYCNIPKKNLFTKAIYLERLWPRSLVWAFAVMIWLLFAC